MLWDYPSRRLEAFSRAVPRSVDVFLPPGAHSISVRVDCPRRPDAARGGHGDRPPSAAGASPSAGCIVARAATVLTVRAPAPALRLDVLFPAADGAAVWLDPAGGALTIAVALHGCPPGFFRDGGAGEHSLRLAFTAGPPQAPLAAAALRMEWALTDIGWAAGGDPGSEARLTGPMMAQIAVAADMLFADAGGEGGDWDEPGSAGAAASRSGDAAAATAGGDGGGEEGEATGRAVRVAFEVRAAAPRRRAAASLDAGALLCRHHNFHTLALQRRRRRAAQAARVRP